MLSLRFFIKTTKFKNYIELATIGSIYRTEYSEQKLFTFQFSSAENKT